MSVRDRVYGQATSSRDGRRSFVGVLLAVSVFVLVTSVSCRQVTAPGPARNLLESGIVTLTDIDQFIADDGPALRQFALESQEPTVEVAGYPLDIVVTRDEVLNSSDEQLRTILLERSSALIYAEGLEAFDRTGEQSLRRFSLQGLLELGVNQVSEDTHDRATLFSAIALAACAVLGAILAATGEGWGRMRSVGVAVTTGAVPVLLIFIGLRFMAGAIGGGDPFVAGLRDITESALSVPVRNALIVIAAGLVVIAASFVLARLERMLTPAQPAPEEEYE